MATNYDYHNAESSTFPEFIFTYIVQWVNELDWLSLTTLILLVTLIIFYFCRKFYYKYTKAGKESLSRKTELRQAYMRKYIAERENFKKLLNKTLGNYKNHSMIRSYNYIFQSQLRDDIYFLDESSDMYFFDDVNFIFYIASFNSFDVKTFYMHSISKCEIILESEVVETTSRASQIIGAAAGGVLLGGVGAIIGGVTGSKKRKETISQCELRIYYDDIANPIRNIKLTNHQGVASTQAVLHNPRTKERIFLSQIDAINWMYAAISAGIRLSEKNNT